MKKISDVLKEKVTFSVELVPPRNGSKVDMMPQLEKLKNMHVDFISVTKGAGGSLRGGTLPISYYAQEKFGLAAISHFTCREIVKERIENDLIDLHYFDLTNILALRGDPPDMQEDFEWGKDGYKYAYELVRQIGHMNQGKYLAREADKVDGEFKEGKPTDFCIGVAAHPEELSGKRVEYLQKKVDEGAHFAITQMIFDVDIFKSFIEDCKAAGITIPIIAGVWPLEAKWKLAHAEEKFKVTVPSSTKAALADIDDKDEFRKKGIAETAKLCKELLDAGAAGIHLFVFQNADVAEEVFSQLER